MRNEEKGNNKEKGEFYGLVGKEKEGEREKKKDEKEKGGRWLSVTVEEE